MEVILGNNFLIRHKAVIDFHKWVLELDEIEPIRISFEWVVGTIRVSGIKVIQNRVGDADTVVRIDVCRESEC